MATELEDLKHLIRTAGEDGVKVNTIRKTYGGQSNFMIDQLMKSGDFIMDKAPVQSFDPIWIIRRK